MFCILIYHCDYLISECSAFVFGAMSFVDKVSGAAAIIVIQYNAPMKLDPCEINCDYFQYVLVYSCGSASLLGLLVISLLYPMIIGQR